ncbi:MAG: DUF3604 domain-containing protein [Candidatus Lokiarchaeota archaeon]|nr:DUF3604 domain-containing protein [Candidatus Lokiarchaeota archaeon]
MQGLKLQELKIQPNLVKVRQLVNIKISFSLEIPLLNYSSLIFRFRGGRNNKNDWYILQTRDFNENGYSQLTTEQEHDFFPILVNGKELEIHFLVCNENGIDSGVNFTFEIYKTLAQSISEKHKKIEVLIEIDKNERFKALNSPTLEIISEKFDHITVISPSIVFPEEPMKTILRVEDKYNNIVEGLKGNLNFFYSTPEGIRQRIDGVSIEQRTQGIYRINTKAPIIPGYYTIEISYQQGLYSSNIFECRNERNGKKLFWGYLHGHTNKSDGMLDISDYFNNLINAGLDFGTSTEHDHLYETSNEDFNEIRSVVKNYHKDGEFVSIFAYEYGTWYTGYGDICVYHFNDGIPILRSEINKYNSTPKFFKNLKPYENKVLLIGHHSALRPGFRNWDYFDNTLERLVEIYSTWGNQEYSHLEGNPLPPRYKFYGHGKHALKRGPILERKGSFVQDALQRGYKLGFTAGGDDHFGAFPSGPMDPDNGLYPSGIMAIWADQLTKEALWDAMINRKCYGTTGPRVIIEFSLNNNFMGEILELEDHLDLINERRLQIAITSPIPINRIEIIRNNDILFTKSAKENIFSFQYLDSIRINEIMLKNSQKDELFLYYYLRTFLEGSHMAWSSPIWIISSLSP